MSSDDQKYRAKQFGLTKHYTEAEWEALCIRFDCRCVRCGSVQPLTPDHVIPLSRRGTNTIDNIQPLCLPCNISKNDKHVDYRADPFQHKPIYRDNNLLSVRIPDDVYTWLSERAKREQRTVSNLVILVLKKEMNVATNGAGATTDTDPPQHNA